MLAPTNEALAGLLQASGLTTDEFLEDIDAARQVLLTHVVPGAALRSSQLSAGQRLESLSGAELVVQAAPLAIKSPSAPAAEVVTADVQACLSVVHVVDAVLLP